MKRSVIIPLVILAMLILVAVLFLTNTMVWFMGVFFILVSVLKLADWRGFVHAYSMYDLIAMRSKLYAWVYPIIELGLGIAFLVGEFFSLNTIFPAAVITLIVMSISTVGVARNLLSKNPVRCACLGTLIKIPLTHVTLVEDILMVVMALLIIL